MSKQSTLSTPLKPGDHVVYTGPCMDIGGVKTGTSGVVDRFTASGDVAYVRWDKIEVHAVSCKDRRSLRRK